MAKKLNPILKVILCGVNDENSPFSSLLGMPHVVKMIWINIVDYWLSHISQGEPYALHIGGFGSIPDENGIIGVCEVIEVQFPKPENIDINMMPFIMAVSFENTALPKKFKKYHKQFIFHCLRHDPELEGKVCYLTIQESYVHPETSQRRPGIHVESPGYISLKDEKDPSKELNVDLIEGAGVAECNPVFAHWGFGYNHRYSCHGGIYMASNVSNSCKLWNNKILQNTDSDFEVVGDFGDIEHLREFMDEGYNAQPNMLYWLTDRTPHESIPLKEKTYRQFFRLVTDDVTVWFEDHSTKNPMGIVPDPNITKIVRGNKFDKNGELVIVLPETEKEQKKKKKKWLFS